MLSLLFDKFAGAGYLIDEMTLVGRASAYSLTWKKKACSLVSSETVS